MKVVHFEAEQLNYRNGLIRRSYFFDHTFRVKIINIDTHTQVKNKKILFNSKN